MLTAPGQKVSNRIAGIQGVKCAHLATKVKDYEKVFGISISSHGIKQAKKLNKKIARKGTKFVFCFGLPFSTFFHVQFLELPFFHVVVHLVPPWVRLVPSLSHVSVVATIFFAFVNLFSYFS